MANQAQPAAKSPFVQTTKAHSAKVKLSRKVRYELDGGDRKQVKAFKVKVETGAITVCVPGRRLVNLRPPHVSGRPLSEKRIEHSLLPQSLSR
jgi:hypothetical protein